MPSAGRDRRRVAEVGLAAVMLAISAAVWWSSLDLPPAMLEPIGPAAFPRVVAAILGLLALVVLGGALRRREAPKPDPTDAGPRRPGLALVTLALTIAYIGAMELGWLGFRVATVVYLLALGAALAGLDRRRLIPVVATAIILGIGAH